MTRRRCALEIVGTIALGLVAGALVSLALLGGDLLGLLVDAIIHLIRYGV
jgi:hypothetical protein